MQATTKIEVENISASQLFEMFKCLGSQIQAIADRMDTPTPTDGFLTRDEAAERLRISLPTLQSLKNRGIITPYRVGGKVLYKLSEVDAAAKPAKRRGAA